MANQELLANRQIGDRGFLPQGSMGSCGLSVQVTEIDGRKTVIIIHPQHDNHEAELSPDEISTIDWNSKPST